MKTRAVAKRIQRFEIVKKSKASPCSVIMALRASSGVPGAAAGSSAGAAGASAGAAAAGAVAVTGASWAVRVASVVNPHTLTARAAARRHPIQLCFLISIAF